MKKLYFKEKIVKILDHFPVLDEDGRTAYYIDQELGIVYKVRVTDADGKDVFRINRELISIFPRYTVNFATGQKLTVEQKFAMLGKKVEVYLDGDKISLNGDIINLNYQVENSAGKLIGAMNKKFLALSDTYELTIYDEEYEEELVALTLCLNNINDVWEKRN